MTPKYYFTGNYIICATDLASAAAIATEVFGETIALTEVNADFQWESDCPVLYDQVAYQLYRSSVR